jgi:Fis family transcriptional regulator, factor for inversion stimulation protein
MNHLISIPQLDDQVVNNQHKQPSQMALIEKYSMSKDSIQEAVHKNLEKYFRDLGEQPASNIYDMVVLAVEKPMLEMIMTRTDCNQSQAADMLGINRNTLRKKLQQHGLL